MGISLPASPQNTSSAGMDLVTLFIVNQIAAKKVNKDPPKVAVLGRSKGGSKRKRNEPLVLPMSPCSPSQLSLVESQPQHSNTETRDHTRHEVTFSLNQPEDREPMLDFTLNQSETEQHIEEDVFRGFNTEERERDACLEHNNSPMNSSDCSPSYSCGGGYLSTDSSGDEECNHQACCADSLNPNLTPQGLPRPLTPLLKPKMNFRDEQEVMENMASPDKAIGSNSQQLGSRTAQPNSPQAQTQSSEPCKCRKTPGDRRDAATQTVDIPAAETCDASTQCSFVVDSGTKAGEFNLCLPPVEVSVQHPATGRQTDTASTQNTHTPSPGKERSRWRYTPWSKKKSRADSLSGNSSKFTVGDSDGKVILQTHKPLQRCSEHD
ncbi:hypothetical protein GBF38_001675 [Nibea albiflora]|uniref:Uncharacterized protein n=1 Tax=Nibea albiflora TaxID=240163 RepID=A0ACB7EVB2_NIBAL|nr:hypothetical protein GBF38_001675 [Nibea albiflora]